jgi:flavin-dependent dehydrogenase
MVLRNTFDAGLVNLASQSGAVFLGGKAAVHINTSTEHAQVTLNDGTTIDASYIIGADGMWSTLAKQLQGPQKHQYIGMCVLEEYPVRNEIMDQWFGEQRRVHIHLNIFGIAGYGWVFPKKEHVNIGLCEFRHALKSPHQKKNLKTLYAQYMNRPLARTYGMRTVLCGDAGGLTNPLTGEGIYYAMVSGEIASKVLIDAISNSRTDERALSRYQRGWMNDFGNDHKRYFVVSKRWRSEIENTVRLIDHDQKIIDLVLSVVMEPLSLKKIRWKIARRFIHLYLRDLLGQ